MFRDINDMNAARDALSAWIKSQDFERYDAATVCFSLLALLMYEGAEDDLFQLFLVRNVQIFDESLRLMRIINLLPKEE